jgi:hypothetical protein
MWVDKRAAEALKAKAVFHVHLAAAFADGRSKAHITVVRCGRVGSSRLSSGRLLANRPEGCKGAPGPVRFGSPRAA